MGNNRKNPLMLACRLLDLNVEQDRNDGSQNVEDFEDGGFTTIKPTCDRRMHAHPTTRVSRPG